MQQEGNAEHGQLEGNESSCCIEPKKVTVPCEKVEPLFFLDYFAKKDHASYQTVKSHIAVGFRVLR